MGSYVRISALLWADILVSFALFVMQNYLTKVWKISFVHAAAILNVWGGLSLILPVFFLFLVDTLLGNFLMLVISSVSYSVGIALVTFSTPPVLSDITNTCNDYEPRCIGSTQRNLFYIGMALIAVGAAGNGVSVAPFLKEQGKNNDGGLKEVLRLPGLLVIVIVPVVGAFALPYVKPWALRFGIPAICTAVATPLFLSGFCMYSSWRYEKVGPRGSPLTTVCRVFVAAAFKIRLPLDNQQFYKENGKENESFSPTRLRFLHKAAIIVPSTPPAQDPQKSWRLCSVSEVEDTKAAIRMVPMSATFIVCGIVSSFGNTYFLEQANHMNRKVGKWKVPLQVLLLLSMWAKNWFFKPRATSLLKNNSRYRPSIGIAVAMTFSILCCITAARVELLRLKVIKRNGLINKPESHIPMSVFMLLFQFFLLTGLDTFFEMSVEKFYKDQSPPCMTSYLTCFAKGVSGLGFMSNVLLVHLVGVISKKGGKKSWFQSTLSLSRLDKYYWLLSALSSVNLALYALVAYCYRYKDPDQPNEEMRGPQGGTTSIPPDDSGSNVCCNLFG